MRTLTEILNLVFSDWEGPPEYVEAVKRRIIVDWVSFSPNDSMDASLIDVETTPHAETRRPDKCLGFSLCMREGVLHFRTKFVMAKGEETLTAPERVDLIFNKKATLVLKSPIESYLSIESKQDFYIAHVLQTYADETISRK